MNQLPKRSLGQVFLNSGAVVARIVRALQAGPGDAVVEIGPGRGALTSALALAGGPLTVIEKDGRLAESLRVRFAEKVRVVEADATTIDLAEATGDPAAAGLLVVGNLPYNVGTAIVFNVLRQRSRVARIVVMLQREVAHRMAARPGDRDHGSLSLAAQARAGVELLFDVAPTKFVPRPDVWSSVVRLVPAVLPHPAAAAVDAPGFDDLLRALHAQPRKTVANSLADGLRVPRAQAERLLAAAGVDPGLRPAHVTAVQALEVFLASRA